MEAASVVGLVELETTISEKVTDIRYRCIFLINQFEKAIYILTCLVCIRRCSWLSICPTQYCVGLRYQSAASSSPSLSSSTFFHLFLSNSTNNPVLHLSPAQPILGSSLHLFPLGSSHKRTTVNMSTYESTPSSQKEASLSPIQSNPIQHKKEHRRKNTTNIPTQSSRTQHNRPLNNNPWPAPPPPRPLHLLRNPLRNHPRPRPPPARRARTRRCERCIL